MLFGRTYGKRSCKVAENLKVRKIKITREALSVFFRTMAVTAVSIICILGIYLGCVNAYEQTRSVCFGDTRAAVILTKDYIKFFDSYIYF